MTDWNIPRDQWHRPLLYTPEGGKRVGHSRCSTLAKDIDKATDGLFAYYQTKALIGMAMTPSIESRVKSLVATGKGWENAKGEFKEIIKTAETVGGSASKADRGTSIHDYCGAVEDGTLNWDLVTEDLKGAVDGYYEFIVSKGVIQFIAREVFLAVNLPIVLPDGRNVKLRAAGSCDRIGEVGNGRKMIEIKTGKDDDFRMGVTGQLALYVEGQAYQDNVVKQDLPWAEFYPNADNTAEFASHGCDYDEAWMLHCPQTANAQGKWEWRVLRVPLAQGRHIVRCGQWARKLRIVPEFKQVDL